MSKSRGTARAEGALDIRTSLRLREGQQTFGHNELRRKHGCRCSGSTSIRPATEDHYPSKVRLREVARLGFEMHTLPSSDSRVMTSPIVSKPFPAKGPHHSSEWAYAGVARISLQRGVSRKSSVPNRVRNAVNGPQHFLRHGFGYSGLMALIFSP